jgi:uncharacterized membrane protein YkgB
MGFAHEGAGFPISQRISPAAALCHMCYNGCATMGVLQWVCYNGGTLADAATADAATVGQLAAPVATTVTLAALLLAAQMLVKLLVKRTSGFLVSIDIFIAPSA